MGLRLNIIAAALFITWIVAFFGYNAGQNIHILFLLSIIIMLVKTFILLPMKEHEAAFGKTNNTNMDATNKNGNDKAFTLTGDWAKQARILKDTFAKLTDSDLKFETGMENDLLSRLQSRLGRKRNDVIELLRVGYIPLVIPTSI